jgi:2-hydroxychromene-2-carboxylate isomerase
MVSARLGGVTPIEIYADIWCPFAHVGLRAVVQRRRDLGRDDKPLRVIGWPLELVNQRPLDPDATQAHVDELRDQVAPDLFAGFDRSRFPTTTLPALALTASAYRQGDGFGERVSLGLRDALFEDGLDISEPDVLAAVARANGVGPAGPGDEAQVLEDWRTGQDRGVKGSPHFFCGELESFCPSLNLERDAGGHLHIRRDAEALGSFLSECLSR